MKTLLISTALAAVLLAPSAFATDDNSAAISGSNNSLIQQTGHDNVLATGSGAFGTTNAGGAGGTATANGGAGGAVIGSGNSSSLALGGTGGQGGRGGDGGTGIGLGGVGIGGSSSATGGSQSQSATTGSQSINVEAQRRNPVAGAASSLLVAAEDACMGSTSAGAQGIGFGLSVGSTWQDGDCVRRKDARELHNMGFKPAAIALMCQNEHVAEAMATAGTPCAGERPVASSAHQAAEWRDRSGYPAGGNESKH